MNEPKESYRSINWKGRRWFWELGLAFDTFQFGFKYGYYDGEHRAFWIGPAYLYWGELSVSETVDTFRDTDGLCKGCGLFVKFKTDKPLCLTCVCNGVRICKNSRNAARSVRRE